MNTDAQTQERVLDAVDPLFNAHGIQAVGMYRIRDASGIPLKRLYQCFPSKSALVEAYLRHRDVRARRMLHEHVSGHPTPRARVLAVFDWLYWWFGETGFRGCVFLNTFSELGAVDEGARRAVRDHKKALRDFFLELARDTGTDDPDQLCDQIAVLFDGAITVAAVFGTQEPARHARDMAAMLLDRSPGTG